MISALNVTQVPAGDNDEVDSLHRRSGPWAQNEVHQKTRSATTAAEELLLTLPHAGHRVAPVPDWPKCCVANLAQRQSTSCHTSNWPGCFCKRGHPANITRRCLVLH